ncbi:MAG: DNRLRE domain-containing protein [candidate division Zixibacteria bacterium]|nr:DNRLRE domain-containing protein [candidate division Zixibacteria bacterium]
MQKINIVRLTVAMALFLTATIAWCGELTLDPAAYAPVQTQVGGEVSKHLVKFDLDTIPSNATIDLAVLTVNVDLDTMNTGPLNLMAYPISESWTGSGSPVVTTVEYEESESLLGPLRGKIDQEGEFVVTDLVQAWVSGKKSNNGLILMVYENPESKLDLKTEKLGAVAKLTVFYSEAPVGE